MHILARIKHNLQDHLRSKASRAFVFFGACAILSAGSSLAFAQPQEANGTRKSEKGLRVGDLSAHYRFVESYLPAKGGELGEGDRQRQAGNAEALIGQYHVGVTRESKRLDEKRKGAPDLAEFSELMVYDEQAFELDVNDRVASVIRRYSRYELTGEDEEDQLKVTEKKPLVGLVVYIRFPRVPGKPAEIIALSGRNLTQYEYALIQKDLFVPALRNLLPPKPVEVGESWAVPDWVGLMLLGQSDEPLAIEKPAEDASKADDAKKRSRKDEREAQSKDPGAVPRAARSSNCDFRAKLLKLEAKTPKSFAYIQVNGFVKEGEDDRTDAAARVVFSFTPDKAQEESGANVIVCRGAITEIRMGKKHILPIIDPDSRLRTVINWDLILDRRLNEPKMIPLPANDATPEATPENSWIDLTDAGDQFSLSHSQNFQLQMINPYRQMVLFWHFPVHRGQAAAIQNTVLLRLTSDLIKPDDVRTQWEQSWKGRFEATVGERGLEKLPESFIANTEAYHLEALDSSNRGSSGRPTETSLRWLCRPVPREGDPNCGGALAQPWSAVASRDRGDARHLQTWSSLESKRRRGTKNRNQIEGRHKTIWDNH